MIIIYNKKTGKVLFKCGMPVNYEDDREIDAIENEEVFEEIEVEETDEFGNVTIKKETVKKTIPKLVKGHTIYFNPDIFDTAEVPDNIPKGRHLIYKDGVISVKQEQARNV